MPLYVVMGAMAGNMMTGNPVWLMLIGPSSCGKTMLLKSLLGLSRVEPVADITGQAALLSGTKRKEVAKDATGGVLRTIGDNGCLLFLDFTSVLSESKEALVKILGVFRHLFDRTWSRDIGGEGGRRLTHTGRVCLMAGVTPAIDRAGEVNREMGERCLYYRYPDTNGYQESMAAAQNTEPEESEARRRELVESMFAIVDLSFEHPAKRRQLEQREADRVITLAQLGVRCRSNVPRDSYTHQVNDVPAPEVPSRMTQELTQLYCGMEVIGNSEGERWKALEKVALDSMPMGRRLALEQIRDTPGQKTGEIARAIRVSERTAQRITEDLDLLGVIENRNGWEVSGWTREKLEAVK